MIAIRPIGTSMTLIRSAFWLTVMLAAIATVAGAGRLLLIGFFFPGSAPATALAMPGLGAFLYVLILSTAIAMLTIMASRLLTVGIPIAAIAAPLIVLMGFSTGILGFPCQICKWLEGFPIFLNIARSPALIVFAMIVGLALMTPMANWRSNRAAVSYVVLLGLAALPFAFGMIVTMSSMETKPADLKPLGFLPFEYISTLIGMPVPILYLLAFLAVGFAQRWTSSKVERTFDPIKIGRPLAVALVFGTVPALAEALMTIEIRHPYHIVANVPAQMFTSAWIYWLPALAVLLAWQRRPGLKVLTAPLVAMSFVPLSLWFVAAIPYFEGWTIGRVSDASPPNWKAEQGRSYVALMPISSERIKADTEAKGMGEPYVGSGLPPTGVSQYMRRSSREVYGGSDAFLIAYPEKGDMKIRHIVGTYQLQAHALEDGVRRYVGTMRFLQDHSGPSFPPSLHNGRFRSNATRVAGGSKGKEPDAIQQAIERMISAIPPR